MNAILQNKTVRSERVSKLSEESFELEYAVSEANPKLCSYIRTY